MADTETTAETTTTTDEESTYTMTHGELNWDTKYNEFVKYVIGKLKKAVYTD